MTLKYFCSLEALFQPASQVVTVHKCSPHIESRSCDGASARSTPKIAKGRKHDAFAGMLWGNRELASPIKCNTLVVLVLLLNPNQHPASRILSLGWTRERIEGEKRQHPTRPATDKRDEVFDVRKGNDWIWFNHTHKRTHTHTHTRVHEIGSQRKLISLSLLLCPSVRRSVGLTVSFALD